MTSGRLQLQTTPATGRPRRVEICRTTVKRHHTTVASPRPLLALSPFCSPVAYLSCRYSPSPGLGQASNRLLFSPALLSRACRLLPLTSSIIMPVMNSQPCHWNHTGQHGLHHYVSFPLASTHTHPPSPFLSGNKQPAHTAFCPTLHAFSELARRLYFRHSTRIHSQTQSQRHMLYS